MHRFFRDSPQALTQLLEAADFPGFPEIVSAKRLPEDQTVTDPVERRVDTVLALLKHVAKVLKQADPTVRVEFARAIWLALNPGLGAKS